MSIVVRDNIAQVLASMERYKRDVVEKATVLALNRVVEMAKTDAAREVRAAGYNLKAARIKAEISVKKASTGLLTATLRVKRRPIPLIDYDARQTNKGVSVKVQKKRTVVPHSFIATMPSGHKGVFVRKDGARPKYKVKGGKVVSTTVPIRELYGPSVGGAYANEQVQAAMERSIRANFNARLRHEVSRLSR